MLIARPLFSFFPLCFMYGVANVPVLVIHFTTCYNQLDHVATFSAESPLILSPVWDCDHPLFWWWSRDKRRGCEFLNRTILSEENLDDYLMCWNIWTSELLFLVVIWNFCYVFVHLCGHCLHMCLTFAGLASYELFQSHRVSILGVPH